MVNERDINNPHNKMTETEKQLIEVVKTLKTLLKDSNERADKLRELLLLEKEAHSELIKTPAETENDARMAGLFKRPKNATLQSIAEKIDDVNHAITKTT